jgi:hypothetical protein
MGRHGWIGRRRTRMKEVLTPRRQARHCCTACRVTARVKALIVPLHPAARLTRLRPANAWSAAAGQGIADRPAEGPGHCEPAGGWVSPSAAAAACEFIASVKPTEKRQEHQRWTLNSQFASLRLGAGGNGQGPLETLVVSGKDQHQEVGQDNGANPAGISDSGPRVDQDEIEIGFPFATPALENFPASLFAEEGVP